MSLPKYYFLSERTLRDRDQDPKIFAEKAAEQERNILKWDTDGGYAKLIQESREAAGPGNETAAELLLLDTLSHMAAKRYFELEREREEKGEIKEEVEEEEERERKLAAKKELKQEEEEETEYRRRKQRKTAAVKRKKKSPRKGGGTTKKEKNQRIDFSAIGLDPPPRDFADVIKERNVGVRDVKLVIMKELFQTDLSSNHNRFSMPALQIIDGDFTTAEEDACFSGINPPGVPVLLIGPTEDETTEMNLKRWPINKSISYVLNKNWMSLVRKFPEVFRKRTIVQLWSFRTANGELRFQIHMIRQLPTSSGSDVQPAGIASGSGGSGGESNNHDGDVSGGSDGSGRPTSSGTEDDDLSPPPLRRRLLPPPPM